MRWDIGDLFSDSYDASNTIIPIPYTKSFIADDIHFVTQPINKQIETALVLGSSEGCNHYAIIIRKPL